jgi:hypothetical protein
MPDKSHDHNAATTADFSALALAPLEDPASTTADPAPLAVPDLAAFASTLQLELAAPSPIPPSAEPPPPPIAFPDFDLSPAPELTVTDPTPVDAAPDQASSLPIPAAFLVDVAAVQDTPAIHTPRPPVSAPVTATAPAARQPASCAGVVLTATIANDLKRAIAEGRISLSDFSDADDRGCQMLLSMIKAAPGVELVGAGRFIGVLARKTLARRPDERHVWLLLIDIYQRLNRRVQFDDATTRYGQLFSGTPAAPAWSDSAVGRCTV